MNSAVHKLHLHPNVQLQPSRTFSHATACNHIDISLPTQQSKCDNSPASTTMELQLLPPKSKLTYSIRSIVWKHTGHSARRQHTKSPSVLHRQQSTSQARGGFPLSLLDHNMPAGHSKGFLPAFPSHPRHHRRRALQPCDRHATRRPRSSSTRR